MLNESEQVLTLLSLFVLTLPIHHRSPPPPFTAGHTHCVIPKNGNLLQKFNFPLTTLVALVSGSPQDPIYLSIDFISS